MSDTANGDTIEITIQFPSALAEGMDSLNSKLGWDRQTFLRLAARAYLSAMEHDDLGQPPRVRSGPTEDRR